MKKTPDRLLKEIRIDIKKHGWYVIAVGAESKRPAFGYSVGFYQSFGHPEVLITGLEFETVHAIIDKIGEKVRHGANFTDRAKYTGLLTGKFRCAMRPVKSKYYDDWLCVGLAYYEKANFPVLHCVWPDFNNRLPWDDGFDRRYKSLQPDLS